MAVLMKAADCTPPRADDEEARAAAGRLMLALTSNAYHTVAEQGVIELGPGGRNAWASFERQRPAVTGGYSLRA